MATNQAGQAQARPLSGLDRLLRRRRFLIHRRIQYALLFSSLGHVLLVTTVVGVVLFLPLWMDLHGEEATSEAAARAARQILYLHARFWPAIGLALVLTALDSIRTSHRIAGPLFRFSQVLREVRAGRVPDRIVLREGDLLRVECDEINAALVEVRRKVDEIHEARLELLRAVDDAESIGTGAGGAAESQARAELAVRARRLAAATELFHPLRANR